MFARIARAGAIAGPACGALLTLLQQFEVVPLIRQAEAFEPGGAGHAPLLWATLAANVVLATGFALLLAAALAFDHAAGWRRGLIWGAAGYLAFFVAPALGLPPELPGAEVAPLGARQLWWAAAAAFCAAGLGLAIFARRAPLRVLGLFLIAAPHIAGAPAHSLHAGSLPPELHRAFVRATYLANGAFWLALGALVGQLLSASGRPARKTG